MVPASAMAAHRPGLRWLITNWRPAAGQGQGEGVELLGRPRYPAPSSSGRLTQAPVLHSGLRWAGCALRHARWRPSGGPDDEFGGQQVHRFAGSLGEEIEQDPGGKLTLTAVGLPDGADLEGIGSWRIVEADDREVIGNAQTEPAGRLQGAFSEPVGQAEKTSGPRCPGQERGGHGGALVDGAGGSRCYRDRRPVHPGADDRIAVAG